MQRIPSPAASNFVAMENMRIKVHSNMTTTCMHAMHDALEHSYMTTVPLTLVAAIAAASAPLQEGISQKRLGEGIIQERS